MIMYILLAAVTAVYLIQSAVMDIKEKKIYSFPCMVLTILWGVYLIYTQERELQFLVSFWMMHIFIFTIFNKCKIWGEGDSDVLLLFGNVLLIVTGTISGFAVAFYECIGLMIALFISLLIGCIEYRIRHKEIKIKGNVAVVPGFSVVMCVLMLVTGIWRYLL